MKRFIAIAALSMLAACSATQDERKSTIMKIDLAYGTTLAVATAYTVLPPCTDQVASICSLPTAVAEIKKAIPIADALVQNAKDLVANSTDTNVFSTAMKMVAEAAGLLTKIFATYGVRA